MDKRFRNLVGFGYKSYVIDTIFYLAVDTYIMFDKDQCFNFLSFLY